MSIYDKILDICLEEGFSFFSTLPCSYNTTMLEKLDELNGKTINNSPLKLIHIPLVREESGVALNAGAFIGGRKTAMVFQNQGLGNMVTQMLSLNSDLEGSYHIPNLYIVSLRGQEGEKIGAQKPVGEKTKDILDLVGVKYCVVKDEKDLPHFAQLIKEYDKGYSIAILVQPEYGKNLYRIPSKTHITRKLSGTNIKSKEITINYSRYDAISTIMNEIKEELVVSNLGHPSRELHDIIDRARNFYLASCLGQSYMLSLGIALATHDLSEKIVCFEGDGGILMNSGSLSILSHLSPQNLIIILLDNGVYGSTGNITTYASQNINISGLFQAYGFPEENIFVISSKQELKKKIDYALIHNGPFVLHALVNDEYDPVPIIPFSVRETKKRFMKEIRKIRNSK